MQVYKYRCNEAIIKYTSSDVDLCLNGQGYVVNDYSRLLTRSQCYMVSGTHILARDQ